MGIAVSDAGLGVDDFGYSAPTGTVSRPPKLPLVIALVVPPLATLLATLGSFGAMVTAYATTLIVGTGALAWFRLEDGRRSRNSRHIENPTMVRLAVVAAVLIVVCCGISGFLLATELAK
jgi:hypothetical protein